MPRDRVKSAANEPAFVKVRARDVKPYHYGVWCSIGDGEPFANTICHIQWSDDGEHLWFGLDSHNTYKAAPDEMLDLVETTAFERTRAKYVDWELPLFGCSCSDALFTGARRVDRLCPHHGDPEAVSTKAARLRFGAELLEQRATTLRGGS